jgi:hypothetical protein
MMTKCIDRLREHKVAIILALFTSVLVAFPQAYFRIDHPELYTDGVAAIEMLPDSPWSARVREVQDGHANFGSIYFKEGKDDPYLFQPLGSIIVAYTGALFGLEINNTLLLSRLVFPFLTFLLMYGFVFLVSRNKGAALACTSAILLIEALLSPSGLKGLITGGILNGTSPVNFLELSRPVNSAMIFIFLFGFLVSFWLYYERRGWQWGVLSAVVLGLNFYNYFYSWTYLFAFGGVLTILLLIHKKWHEARRVVYVFLGALLVAIPYIWNLYSASLYPSYEEVGKRLGLIASHGPHFIGAIALGAIVVFLLGFPRADKQKYIFGLSLLLAPFVTLNQQILTGRVMQEGHYHWYMHKPMAIIFVTIVVFHFLDSMKVRKQYKTLLVLCIVLISFAVGFKVQLLSYMHGRESGDGGHVAIERQRYAPVMHWLSTHAHSESVVFANEETSHITVIYTPLNVFYQEVAHASLVATDARMMDIIFTYYRLRGVDRENVRETFYREKKSISSTMYGLYYREKTDGGGDADIPDAVLNDIIERYEQTLDTPTSEWLSTMWKKYEVKHLVWDRKTDPEWQLGQYNFLEEVAVFDDLTLFRFSPKE